MRSTSTLALSARRWLRRWPTLQRTAVVVARRFQGGYEERFAAALDASIHAGDCVWDVGANVGEYTERFARAVGTDGTVVAIEPSPECVARLEDLRRELSHITVIETALAAEVGRVQFSVTDGPTAVSNRIGTGDGEAVEVATTTADSLVRAGTPVPNVMKIDVEGYEGDVIDGMHELLLDPRLRALYMEIHFAQLDADGRPGDAQRIAARLESTGFSLRWPDPSHLIATRSPSG